MNMMRMMMSRFNIGTLAVALAATVVLVGCDDDDDGGTTTSMVGTDVATVDPSVEVMPEELTEETLPGEMQTDTVTYPASATEGTAMIVERITPTKVSAGKAFTYQIRLMNMTAEPMSGIALRETLPATFTVQSTEPAATPAPTADPTQPRVLQWTVDVPPGDSTAVKITGITEQPGALSRTLTITGAGGTAELTGAVDIAQPVVLVTREGPDRVELCDPISYKYSVTNNGDGDTGAFQITETLPAGLTTDKGAGAVSFELGSLAKGEKKEFVVQLKSTKPGEFTGHAVAKGSFGEMVSKPLTTVVVSPKLGIDIQAPVWEEVGSPVMYQVTVRNDGDAPARDVTLAFQSAGIQGAQLVTGPDMDTPAPPPATLPSVLGTIEPKTTQVMSYTLRPPTKGQLTVNVTATAKCGQQPAAASAAASAQPPPPPEPYRAAGQAQTSIVGMPASALEVADQDDPIVPGGEINYRVVVQNYGSANDRDVALVVKLPEGVTVGADGVQGPNKPKVEGQTLTFPVMAVLAPNQPQQWTIKATAPAEAGQKRVRAELRSATLIAPIVQTETTRVATPLAQ